MQILWLSDRQACVDVLIRVITLKRSKRMGSRLNQQALSPRL